MLLTWSSAVIGLATLTVIGTVLPFSTNGGMSSLTLPVRTSAVPVTLRMAEASIAGVAWSGRTVTTGIAPATAMPPAKPRNWRRVDGVGLRIDLCASLVAQRCKVSHDILDLFRRQDRLSLPVPADALESVRAIIGRHDRCWIEARRVHQPQPELGVGRAAAGAGEIGREVALEPGFWKRPGVAENAGAGAVQHQRAAARGIARRTCQRLRNAVADDRIACKRLRVGRAGQGEDGCDQPCHVVCRSEARWVLT